MSRPTKVAINAQALVHNLKKIKSLAPEQKICAMVKANAYGCRFTQVIPALDGRVDFFGVISLAEALAVVQLGALTPCLLVQGVFSAEEYQQVASHDFSCVIHHMLQLQWLVEKPLPKPIKLWIKVNTGMHRLGFQVEELSKVLELIKKCPWIDANLGLMTHLSCADEPLNEVNQTQLNLFKAINFPEFKQKSIANSAALMSFPQALGDMVRPGIMLYGISPFANLHGQDLGLKPVMQFTSAITVVNHYPAGAAIGYGGTWSAKRPSRIGLVAAGYGDGYPRHIAANTPVWIKGRQCPIVGRISMDSMTVDITDHEDIHVGDEVELWGMHLPVETIAKSAGTIAYELLCQVTNRLFQI